jgi:hypothetical protein
MIDPEIEPYYDIMISCFIGFVMIIIINSFFESPRIVEIDPSILNNEAK